MSGSRMFDTSIRGAALLVLTTLWACGSEPPAPAPRPTPAPEKKAEPKAEPEPEPEPKPKLDVPAPAPIEHCKIVIKGEGPKLVKAAVRAVPAEGAEPNIKEAAVDEADGRTIDYDCPAPELKTNVDLIGVDEDDKVVHWRGVSVSETGEGDVDNAARQEGLPPDLSPEEIEILAKHRGISVEEVVTEQAKAEPKSTRSPVVFMPNDLAWVEIELRGKRTQKLTLTGKKSKPLAAGSYQVFFRTSKDGEWTKAGASLDIEADKSYEVKMLKRPPHIKISVK